MSHETRRCRKVTSPESYITKYPLAGLKNKVSIYISGLLRNFAPNFCPFSNLKAQILEIWPSAPESAKKNRAAMKS